MNMTVQKNEAGERVDLEEVFRDIRVSRTEFALEAGLNVATIRRYAEGFAFTEETDRKIKEAIARFKDRMMKSAAIGRATQGLAGAGTAPAPAASTDDDVEVAVVSIPKDGRCKVIFLKHGQPAFFHYCDREQASHLKTTYGQIEALLSQLV